MALISPGIEKKEINMSATIGRAATGRACMVGKFQWGPAFQVSQVTSDTDLVNMFGLSDDYTAASHMSAGNFLRYADDLRIVRIVDPDTAKNASPLYSAIDYTISPSAHSGYSVGDEITVSYASTDVNPTTRGRVTATGANGTILAVYIPSKEINAYADANGIADYSGFTVSVSSDSGGSGAQITISKVTDSRLYFPNQDLAPAAIETIGDTAFKAMCEKLGIPTLAATYPGSFGDTVSVFIANKTDFDASITPRPGFVANGNIDLEVFPSGGEINVNFKSYFQFAPANDQQYAILVRVGDTIVETHMVSTNPSDKDINGQSIYIDDYFDRGASQYIYAMDSNWLNRSGAYILGGGLDANVGSAEWMEGWDMLADPENLYTNLLIAGNVADEPIEIASTVQRYAASIADTRADALLLVSPPKELVINKTTADAVKAIVAWRRGFDDQGVAQDHNLNISSSYIAMDGNYKYQYDKYSERYRWVPFAADVAGLCAYTDQVGQPWMSPAGHIRGVIKNVRKVAIDTKRAHRDALYEVGINPIVSFAGEGTILYGDKTGVQMASAFDRINVRRLFNLLKKAIGDAAKYKLFELNDEFTRASFKSEVDAYLDNIRALGGIYDFRVVCDESNNTGVVIDRNEFVASIYVKPARSINFITLNFIATGTSVNFDEVIG